MSRSSPFHLGRMLVDLAFGLAGARVEPVAPIAPGLTGTTLIDAQRPNKYFIGHVGGWLGILILIAVIGWLNMIGLIIIPEFLTLVLAYRLAVRVLTQSNEYFRPGTLVTRIKKEFSYFGLFRFSLLTIAVTGAIRILALLVDGLDSLLYPSVFPPELASLGYREMTPLHIIAEVLRMLGALNGIALIGMCIGVWSLARRIVKERRLDYKALKEIELAIPALLGVSSKQLMLESEITFDGDAVVIDPVPLAARSDLETIRERAIMLKVPKMLREDSSPTYLAFVAADADELKRREYFEASGGLVYSFGEDGVDDGEILGYRSEATGEVQNE